MEISNAKISFAAAVKRSRGRLGLSQEELAERANLHRTYISDVERGARNLSLESISKLARALEMSVAALFTPLDGQAEDAPRQKELVDVLLVEDEPDDVELTLAAFKRARFSNRVDVVNDGQAALDYVFCNGIYAGRQPTNNPQVVLLDLKLPKLSGLDVLRQLKADKRARSIPVVVLTGSESPYDLAECRRMGAETCIPKPVDFQRLAEVTPQLSLTWALLRPAP